MSTRDDEHDEFLKRRADLMAKRVARRRMIADGGGLLCVGLFAVALYLLFDSNTELLIRAGQRAHLATWFDPFITLFFAVRAMRWRLLRYKDQNFKDTADAVWIFVIVLLGSSIVGGISAAIFQAEGPVNQAALDAAMKDAVLFRLLLGVVGTSWWYVPILVAYVRFTRFWTA